MPYDSGKNADGAGAASISPTSLSWTTNALSQRGIADPAYINSRPCGHSHLYRPEYCDTETSQQSTLSDPTVKIGPGHEYYDWEAQLPEASSTLSLPGSANGEPRPHALGDDLLSPQFRACVQNNNQDLTSLLHQDWQHIPEFSADVGSNIGLTEDVTGFVAPKPLSSAIFTHAGAGVVSTEPRSSSEVLSASSHDLSQATLDAPNGGSAKKRKAQAFDLESDAEDGPRVPVRSAKKRRIRNPSAARTADSGPVDIATDSSTMNTVQITKGKTVKSKRVLEVRAQSSSEYRGRISSVIDSLRERLFPGSMKPGTRRRRVQVTADGESSKDKNNETSELQVILKAREEIDEARETIKKLQDNIQDLRDSNEKLRDDVEDLRDNCAAAEQRNLYLRVWIDRNGGGSHGTR